MMAETVLKDFCEDVFDSDFIHKGQGIKGKEKETVI